ncbi:serine hydrolase domain-containing protein [Ornithinibacillus californiensis]|uniref:serine hydrolase domain-containing protein n=1 Tax=Ornithinibacillus californiensis TaxID=161536 RepID=UPI00064D7880|nr:serine hydrolase domain-containing protein [Ornithinibacillus californiensis]
METEKIEKRFSRVIKSKHIHESVLFVENTKGDFSYAKDYGGKSIDTPLLMASITKLFTTTCVLKLLEQSKVSLDDKIVNYFDKPILSELHIYKGHDYTSQLTISHLLYQTSGLPDAYVEGKGSLSKRILSEDIQISFDNMVMLTKKLKPHFSPNTGNKAHYADINFDMLGKIIETVTKSSLEEVFESLIFKPLGLVNTYLPSSGHDSIPSIYYKDTVLSRPKFVNSCKASGGAISTAREMMTFIKAFFGGRLFNKTILDQLDKYNKLQFSMFPIQYSGGYMRVPLHGIGTLFMGKGEIVGHAGSTGSFAFYYPHRDLFFVGDVNQIASHLSVRMPMQLALALK